MYDVGTHEGVRYVVTELLEGGTLRETLRGGPLPAGRAVEIALQIAGGLAAAQEKGFVHRDLKPENVFVARDGHVKILDFGLARQNVPCDLGSGSAVATPDVQNLTREGSLVGTAAYMSPEQARGEGLDGRSDLFSLGVLLHELLTGQRPFQGETTVETLYAVLHAEPKELPPGCGIPPALARIVARCLEKEPGHESGRSVSHGASGGHEPLGQHLEVVAVLLDPPVRVDPLHAESGIPAVGLQDLRHLPRARAPHQQMLKRMVIVVCVWGAIRKGAARAAPGSLNGRTLSETRRYRSPTVTSPDWSISFSLTVNSPVTSRS